MFKSEREAQLPADLVFKRCFQMYPWHVIRSTEQKLWYSIYLAVVMQSWHHYASFCPLRLVASASPGQYGTSSHHSSDSPVPLSRRKKRREESKEKEQRVRVMAWCGDESHLQLPRRANICLRHHISSRPSGNAQPPPYVRCVADNSAQKEKETVAVESRVFSFF